MLVRTALPILVAAPALTGCIASAVVDVATLPVRAAGGAVDAVTTSQSEADEKRGRELRKREEELGRLERRYAREREDCADGDEEACADARATYAEIETLLPTIPAAPE